LNPLASRARGGRSIWGAGVAALGQLALVAGAALAVFPLFWMVSTSLKVMGTEWLFPPQWLPDRPQFGNYLSAWGGTPVLLYVRNSVAVTVLATAGNVLAASFVAFGFARLRFVGRDVWFMVLVSTMMLPSVVTLIPTFVLYRSIGWLDTLLPLTAPYWLGGGAFNVFLIRQFYATLPMELDEASRVDGASSVRIWWDIILPLSGPVLATVAVFGFIHHWNDFLGPLIFTSSSDMRTLALGLKLLVTGGFMNTPWNWVMAASVEMLVPVLVLFFSAQRYFVRGIALTGLAGR